MRGAKTLRRNKMHFDSMPVAEFYEYVMTLNVASIKLSFAKSDSVHHVAIP